MEENSGDPAVNGELRTAGNNGGSGGSAAAGRLDQKNAGTRVQVTYINDNGPVAHEAEVGNSDCGKLLFDPAFPV